RRCRSLSRLGMALSPSSIPYTRDDARPLRTVGLVLCAAVAGCRGHLPCPTEPAGRHDSRAYGRAWVVRDKFQRDLSAAGITLVDWDGQIANPAVKLSISPPCTGTFPATVAVSANGPRLYFDRAANQDATGPRETFRFNDRDSVATLYLSIWPDHDGESE